MSLDKVGMIGVGNMGGRIAKRIAAGGYAVRGYDQEPGKAESAGVPPAGSIGDLVRWADVVFLSLPDSTAVEAVVLGEGGVLAHCRDGQVVVDLSTSNPASTKRLHATLGTRGATFLDAGISGGAAAAERGALTIMAGGPPAALEEVRPILETFSQKVFHMGAVGTGHTAKILNNFLNGISLSATSEVMVAAKRAGLHLKTFLDVLNNSSGVNFATLHRFPYILEGNYLEGGLTGKLMAKDLWLYVDLMRDLHIPSLQGPSCLNVFEIATALGYGDVISNRVVDALGDLAGGIRVQEGA